MDFKTDDNGNVQNALRKVNHHVHKTGENNVVLSSERILEVKEAFIQALRGGGIDEASINEVRAKLGIPTEVKLTTDKREMREMMAARIRPLTRQYVRVLLDRYASGGVGRTAESLAAIAPNVTSMKLSDVVPPQKNVLVAQVAVGKTVDSYFKDEIGEVRNAASSVFERDETTNRVKWEDKVVNAETGETKKVPVFRQNIPGTAILNLQSWLSATYNDLRSASGNILQATKVWFYEAIFGSGKFHGDTHSGNLMIGRNDVTFIDFGNHYQLKSNRADGVNERHELVRVIMGAAFRDKDAAGKGCCHQGVHGHIRQERGRPSPVHDAVRQGNRENRPRKPQDLRLGHHRHPLRRVRRPVRGT